MSLKLLKQINEFKNNRGTYTEAERQILIKSFREEIVNGENAEQQEKGFFGEDFLILI